MPQRISDKRLARLLSTIDDDLKHADEVTVMQLYALDLRDERAALKIAVEALEFYEDRSTWVDDAEPWGTTEIEHDQGKTARTALDRIKEIADATTNK